MSKKEWELVDKMMVGDFGKHEDTPVNDSAPRNDDMSKVMDMTYGVFDEDGAWKTINGTHVFIEGGEITKGPSALTGKKSEGKSESKKESKPSAKSTKTKELSTEEVNKLNDRIYELSEKGKLSEAEQNEMDDLQNRVTASMEARSKRLSKMSPEERRIEQVGALNYKKEQGTLTKADLESAPAGASILTAGGMLYKINPDPNSDLPNGEWSRTKNGKPFTTTQTVANLVGAKEGGSKDMYVLAKGKEDLDRLASSTNLTSKARAGKLTKEDLQSAKPGDVVDIHGIKYYKTADPKKPWTESAKKTKSGDYTSSKVIETMNAYQRMLSSNKRDHERVEKEMAKVKATGKKPYWEDV